MFSSHRKFNLGQLAIVLSLAIPCLIGLIALGTDLTILYLNLAQVQKEADAAVLEGASFLPSNPSLAVSRADAFASEKGIGANEIISTSVAPNRMSVTMMVRRPVRYLFSRIIGVSDGAVTIVATAQVRGLHNTPRLVHVDFKEAR